MGSSTWDDTPAGDAGGWKADNSNSGGDGWTADAGDMSNGIKPQNVSMHDGAANDGGCRICGDEAHFARDCPDKKDNSGECYNCGETGHNKADCPNESVEREFTGDCRICSMPGHRAAECPEKPPPVCRLCKSEGHSASDCEINRATTMFMSLGIEPPKNDKGKIDAGVAWRAIETADADKDVEDIKKCIYQYAMAYPEITFVDLEGTFREAGMNTYLIAKEQAINEAHTIVNLQGKPDLKYVVSFQWSAKPRRARFADGWPDSPEENITRLAKAGFVLDSLKPKCTNCNEFGHLRVNCEQEKNEGGKVAITCANCNLEGHRARDCSEARKSNKKGCRNCGGEDHIAKECTEPPNMDNVECKHCNQMGHFVKDCPEKEPDLCRNCGQEGHRAKECENERVVTCRNCDQQGHMSKECPEPRNMAKVQCRNCDEFGHTSRDCKKPTDWSRVECTNCHEKGHSYKRCTKPAAEEETGGDGGWGGDTGASSGGNGGGWKNSAAPIESSGGGW